MTRQLIAASGALIALAAWPLAPQAAADAGQVIQLQDGTVRCLISPADVPRGVKAEVNCETDGLMFGDSTWSTEKDSAPLNVAVMLGSGEFYFERGDVPGTAEDSGQAASVAAGQTLHLNGWTITGEGYRTRIFNDASRHGLFINAVEVRQF